MKIINYDCLCRAGTGFPPSHAIYVEIGRKGGVGYGQANNNAITGVCISSNSTKIVKP